MSTMHLRKIDLNLLVPLHALLEERSVTRAAQRIHLTQSAMSRGLERLRETLHDDILVRSRGKYELTPRASDLLLELNLLMPRLDQFWSQESFSPSAAEGRIRIAMTDYAATVILPHLLAGCEREAPYISIEVSPWHERSYEDLSAGKVDLVFSPLVVPRMFRIQPLFRDRFVCLSGKRLPGHAACLSLEHYMQCRHLSVETEPNQQNLVDRALAEIGLRRAVLLRVPFLLSALQVLVHTDLLLTTPYRLARLVSERGRVKFMDAPEELPTFQYTGVWHTRLERDPMQVWFRSLVMQTCRQHFADEEREYGDFTGH